MTPAGCSPLSQRTPLCEADLPWEAVPPMAVPAHEHRCPLEAGSLAVPHSFVSCPPESEHSAAEAPSPAGHVAVRSLGRLQKVSSEFIHCLAVG